MSLTLSDGSDAELAALALAGRQDAYRELLPLYERARRQNLISEGCGRWLEHLGRHSAASVRSLCGSSVSRSTSAATGRGGAGCEPFSRALHRWKMPSTCQTTLFPPMYKPPTGQNWRA